MADDKKILIDITIDAEALEKSRDKAILAVVDLDKKLSKLKDQRKKDQEDLTKATEEGNGRQIDSLRKKIALEEAESKSIQQSRREQIKVVQLSNDLIQSSDGKSLQSKEQLRKARGLEQIQLDQLKGTIKQNADGQIVLSKAGEQSVQQLNKFNTGLITFGKSVNDGRENVGNYTNSILDAVDKTGLFGGSLSTVKEAFNAVRSGAASAADGMAKFKQGISDSVSIVTEWAQSGRVAGEQTETSTVSVGQLGGALEKTGKTGVASMNGLKAALASTGIGLLVIALAAVFNYLRQIDPVVEKVEQIFAGVGATVTAIGQTLFEFGKIIFTIGETVVKFLVNPLETIANFSLDGLADGFLGAAKNISTAGVAAANLVKRQQELEDLERRNTILLTKNTIEANKNRALSQDRTKSAQERLLFLERAQALELENLKIEGRASFERLKNIKAEYEEAKKLGTVSDELRTKQVNAANELAKITASIRDKEINDNADGAKLILKDQKDALQGRIGILNEELRALALQGIESIELKKAIIKKQRDAELSESEISNEQRIAIEKKYQNDILELDVETEKKRQDIRKQSQQIAIDGIIDGQTREIAAEALALDAKLEAVKGNSIEESELRLKLIEASAKKVFEIEQKYNAISVEEKKKTAESNRNLEIQESNNTFKAIEGNLKIALSNRSITQEEYDNQILIAKKKSLDDQLESELQYQAQRQILDARAFDQDKQNLEAKKIAGTISQEKYNEELLELQNEFYKKQGQTEIETQVAVNATLNELDALKVENAIATNNAILSNDEKLLQGQQALTDARQQLLLTSISGVSKLISASEDGAKKYGAFLKALAISEVIINLRGEISSNNKMAAANPLNLVPGGQAIVQGILAAQNIKAGIIAGVNIATIAAQKFEYGGYSANDMIKQYNPTFTNSPSGYVNRPTAWMNLAGENGGEWIASNKLLRDPRTAPLIHSLENFQRTGVQSFAVGGFTSPIILPQQVGVNANDIATAVRLAIADLNITPIVSVQEIIDVNQSMQNVRATATL